MATAHGDGQSGDTALPDELTELESRLVKAARQGEELVCSDLAPEQLGVSTDVAHIIRAKLIRELFLGRHGELDPHGVRLHAAHVTGLLDLSYVRAMTGLHLTNCVCDLPVFLQGTHLPCLDLSGSHVHGLHSDGLRVDGDMFLNKQFTSTDHSELGAVRLLGAHIGGELSLNGARLINEAGPALYGDSLRVDGNMVLDKFTAVGDCAIGAVRMVDARIGGQLSLNGARLTNEAGPAFGGDRLQLGGSMFLDGFTAVGHGGDGAVRMVGARIGGQLSLSGARLTNEAGPAFGGDGLQVDRDMFLNDGFTAVGRGELGAVRLPGACIGGQLTVSGARLTNEAGPALDGDGLQVDEDMFLNEEFTAVGHSAAGAVRLAAARIGGVLSLNGARLTNDQGLALYLEDARARSVRLPAVVVCPSGADMTTECDAPSLKVNVGGLEYTSIVDVSWEQWLHLLRRHTTDYMPMPYQQLAARQKAAGHDRDARRTLIAQQQDLRARGQIGGKLSIAVHWLWGALAGYGYRAGRTALALLVVLALAGGLGWWAGHTVIGPGQHAAQHTKSATDPGTACSGLEQIGLGIDRGLPLGSTGIRTYCDLDTASPPGEWFTLAIWVLQALVWALATLAVAGYTGLIRKIT